MTTSASSDSPAIDPEKLKLRDLLTHFTPKQLWGAGSAATALIAATFLFGIWVAKQNHVIELGQERATNLQQATARVEAHRAEMMKRDDQLRQAEDRARAAEDRIKDLQASLDKGGQQQSRVATEVAWLKLKAEFLEHHSRYAYAKLSSPEDLVRAKSLYVGFLQRLWIAQSNRSISVAFGTETIQTESTQVIRKPISPFEPPITRRVSGQRTVLKEVRFPDSSVYVVPNEIAAAVHKLG